MNHILLSATQTAVSLANLSDHQEPVPQQTVINQLSAESRMDADTPYRYFFEFNPQPMWIYSSETLRFLLVNVAATQHYGYTEAEFLSMTIKDIRPAEDIPQFMTSIAQMGPQQGTKSQWRHKKRDGQIIDVEISVHDFTYQGMPARLVLVNDITKHTRTERVLRQREQEQRKLAEHLERERERLAQAQQVAKVGSWEKDLTTNALTWSDETYRIFGMDRTEGSASYEAFIARVHPDDRAAVRKAYQEAVANRTPYAIDHRILREDGSIQIVHERCQTFYDPVDGRPLRSVGTVQDITEQKQTEQKLKQSLDLLRAVTEGTTDAVFAKDKDGRYLMINSQGAGIVGKTPEEILGRDDTSLFEPETARATMEMDRQIMEGGETRTIESVGIGGGVRRVYLSTKGPLYDQGGNIVGLVGISRDITERKQAEEELRVSQHTLREVLDNIPQSIYWKDRNSVFLGCNKALADDLGYSDPSEVIGKTDYDICSKELADTYRADDSIVMASGQPKYSFEEMQTRADGQKVWLNTSKVPIRDEAGTVIGVLGISRDVTERREALEHIRFCSLLLSQVRNAVIVTDLEGFVTYWNRFAETLYQWTAEEAIGKHISDLTVPSQGRESGEEIMRHIRETGYWEGEFEVRRKDGRTFPVRIANTVFRDADGIITGLVGVSTDISESKEAEQTVDRIMEGARCLLWQAEVEEIGEEQLQWKMRFASEQSARRFLPLKVTADLAYSDAWYLSRPVEDRVRTDQFGTREIRAGRSYQQEFRSYSEEGNLHWLSENVRVVSVGEGKWQCTGVCTDITERKQAEQTNRELVRGAQCLLWYAFVEDQDHGLQWSLETPDEEAAQEFFPVSKSAGESYANAWARSRMPEDIPVIAATAKAALRGGQQGYTQQFRCRRTDGEWRWLNETVRIEALSPGRWHCVGVCTDITEQKRAEEERDRFFTLSLDLLCIINPEGYFTRLNPAFETVLGFTQAELMARPILDFIHPDDREASRTVTETLLAGASIQDFEVRFLCQDGFYRWLSWKATFHSGLGYAAAHDITPVKEAEAALRRANEDLELRVMDRTAELMQTNTELLAAKQEAERANHAKSEFLSRMSHELRTPMNAILGFGQILDKQMLTPLQKESTQYILKGGRHLLDLINEVLDMSRVEAGHIEMSLEPISIHEVITESCALIHPLAAERSISLERELPADSDNVHVLADRQRLKQVLINLLSNGIKYNRPGGSVKIYCAPPADNKLRLAVRDTGRGISLEGQKKLFTPFERLEASQSEIEGTGLGLALAQRLATAMGGAITLESAPGEGTTFFIELPLAKAPEEMLDGYAIGTFEPEVVQESTQSACILSIEDNLSNLRLLEVILRARPGITLMPAMQGSVGLDLARQHRPDVILLDINLPDISGREVLARLKDSPLTAGIPVIVLSADATDSQIERLRLAGATAYLTKPLDVNVFLNTLDILLKQKDTDTTPGQEVRL